MMKRPKKKRRSFIAGKKGRNRVRAFPCSKTGNYTIEWWENGHRRSKSLGHKDAEKAEAQAMKVAAAFLDRPQPNRTFRPPSLKQLFDKYLTHVTPTKSKGVADFDRAATRRLLSVLGATTDAASLTFRHWGLYIERRGSGAVTGSSVSPRTVTRDLKLLRSVLNWAKRSGSAGPSGEPLIERNPLEGLPYPKHPNPNRPTISDDEYLKMLAKAEEVGWRFRVALVLAHETGHRIDSICRLRWSDVDLEKGQVRWRAEADKAGREHQTPVSPEAVAALELARANSAGIGDAPIFPAPRDPTRPMSRHYARSLWRRAERAAGIDHVRGRCWHSFRRKFASELIDQPIKKVAMLGGWKDTRTILECYQQPSQEQLRSTLKQRSRSLDPEQDRGKEPREGAA